MTLTRLASDPLWALVSGPRSCHCLFGVSGDWLSFSRMLILNGLVEAVDTGLGHSLVPHSLTG